MGTLSSELGAVLEHVAPAPRVYADANIPAGLVAYMRQTLAWDVYFVMEHPDLRRAPDLEHFRLARQLHRTLVTLDRDYFDDRRFPPDETSGVVVVSASDERQLARVLSRVDRFLLRQASALPLAGLKVHAHPDWPVAPVERHAP
jgi:predicted nuclease of predicted toxin-antitoxin system